MLVEVQQLKAVIMQRQANAANSLRGAQRSQGPHQTVLTRRTMRLDRKTN
jgi:hypothetical protein